MRQIEAAFKTFDISGDGIVTATELREALRRARDLEHRGRGS